MEINPSEWDFKTLRLRARLTKKQCAKYLGKCIKTIERWEQSKPPLIAIRALEFRAGTAPGWINFTFTYRTVTNPLGHTFTPTQIEQYNYIMQLKQEIGRGEALRDLAKQEKECCEIIYLDDYREKLRG
jgi:transcriptional regulator with XRE-family HTH domain